MCAHVCNIVCACLLLSCVVHHCHCFHKELEQHQHKDNHDTKLLENDTLHRDSSSFFVLELFKTYGHNGILGIIDFQVMLQKLGLASSTNYDLLHDCEHSHLSHMKISSKAEYSGSHNISNKLLSVNSSTTSPISISQSKDKDYVDKVSELDTVENFELINSKQNSSLHKGQNTLDYVYSSFQTLNSKCFTAHELLQVHNISVHEDTITTSDFYLLCPAIIHQISNNECIKEILHHGIKTEHEETDEMGIKAWLYASLAVFIISICGLMCVAVIPLIQKLCYHSLLQFLVALAVGSLSGDALLHLLPHSMMVENHSHEDEGNSHSHSNTSVYRGFTALLGIYLFFITERLLKYISNYQKMKQRSKGVPMPKFARSLTNVSGEQSRVVGEKLSHHKHGSYGYKFDPAVVEGYNIEIIETKPQKTFPVCELSECNLDEKQMSIDEGTKRLVDQSELVIQHDLSNDNDESLSGDKYTDESSAKLSNCDAKENKNSISVTLKPLSVDVTYVPPEKQQNPETPTEECHRETVVYRHANDDHSYVVTVTDHHHHRHGHSHEVPNTVSSVAWMVVMGDGLHNFCDGLAIGTSFGSGKSGLPGAISTSVAVLLHELPHEIGDFAMLLKAGMSIKQAIMYNSISSILCFIGTCIGVSLGSIPSVTNWIFAGAAGMFLYIALVDMLPELSTISEHSGGSFLHLILQCLGITIGISIMLIIALYEHDLQQLVS